MDQIQSLWYAWGALIACVIALVAAFGVFLDAQRKQVDAVVWKMLSIFAVVVIIPSVFLAVLADLRAALAAALLPLALLGIVATLLALVAVIFQVAGIGAGGGTRCANCGRPRDPTWTFCPYCEYDKPQIEMPTPIYQPPTPVYQPPTPVYQSPPPPPLAPTPTYAQPSPSPQPPADETTQLPTTGESAPPTPKAPETRILRAQPSSSSLAYLVIRAGIHEGKTFQLSDVTNIGRQADANDIVLDDDGVSRQHARVRFEKDKFVLFDLASSNGTFVQDRETGEWKKIQQRALVEGMRIKIGETILSFMQVKASKES
jgi:hypothetical protein